MAEAVVPVLAGDEVVACASARETVALVHAWVLRDGQPPWDVRGRYPAEVRAAAEQAWQRLAKEQETGYERRPEAVLALHGTWAGNRLCVLCGKPWPCGSVRAARGET